MIVDKRNSSTVPGYLASWSGGKDSAFACYRAMLEGKRIARIVHFAREFNLHGVDPELIRIQAGLTGIPVTQRMVTTDDFEREFRETVEGVRDNDTEGIVFGDIYLEPHLEWVERVCGDMGLEAIEPLWGIDTEELMRAFLAAGFETVIVSGREEMIGREWIGRKADEEFIAYLKDRDLDVCGENGEFHTLVTAGPIFRGRIEIKDTRIEKVNGHLFLRIDKFNIRG